MRMFPCRTVCHAIALIALVAASSGCVKRMSATNEPALSEPSRFARLRSVTVSPDASRIELTSDKPFTYTSYKAGEPPKIVVDVSQAEPGAVATPLVVNRGNIRRIDLVRQPVGGGVLTRVEVSLTRDVDFNAATDPANKSKLVLTLTPVENEAKPLHTEAKEQPLAESRIEEHPLLPEQGRHETAAPATVKVASVEPVQLPQPAPVKMAAAAATSPAAPSAAPVAPAAPAAAKAKGGRSLNAILNAPDGVELSIQGGVQTFNSFRLRKPERIVIDLFGLNNTLPSNVVPIGAFGVANARVGSTPDKVRIVLDASGETLPPFEVTKSDLGLKIRLKPQAPAEVARQAAPAARPAAPVAPAERRIVTPPAPVPPPPVAAALVPVAPAAPAPARPVPALPSPARVKVEAPPVHTGKGSLEAVDFKVVDGVSRITMKLYGTCEPGEPVRGVQGLSLTIRKCQVPKQLQRVLDTSKFGTPVVSVTPYQDKVKNLTKVLVRLRGNPRFSVNRRGDTLVWDIVNPAPVAAPRLPAAPAPRSRVAPEPRVAEELAAPVRGNEPTEIVTGESSHIAKKVYHGRRVTLEFSDADIRKIFQLIAEVSNLNFLISDDVTGTITIKLVNVPWDQALDVILDSKGLGMQREGNIVQIKPKSRIQTQADEELAAKKAAERTMELRTAVFEVNYAAVADVAAQFNAIKSERGTITRDERTSRVIVKDIQSALDEMRQLLKTLDAPEKQVMIEARIVEATSTFTRDLGVQWGLHYRDGSASVAGINTVDSGFGGVVSPAGPGTEGSGGIGLGMSFGKLSSNLQLDMRLSAAATIGDIKIISTPKVVTLNNKAAKISQGQSIPYQTTSAEGTKTEFVEAALTLEVTPHITADGSVSMKIKASNNSPGTGSPPPINKKEATTELVVKNGETTVIGGIYVDSDTESDTGIPFLSDIPLLGWLFKSNSKQKTKTELLIFITPKAII
jgi:type IV pilus assembly protein PilQ